MVDDGRSPSASSRPWPIGQRLRSTVGRCAPAPRRNLHRPKAPSLLRFAEAPPALRCRRRPKARTSQRSGCGVTHLGRRCGLGQCGRHPRCWQHGRLSWGPSWARWWYPKRTTRLRRSRLRRSRLRRTCRGPVETGLSSPAEMSPPMYTSGPVCSAGASTTAANMRRS